MHYYSLRGLLCWFVKRSPITVMHVKQKQRKHLKSINLVYNFIFLLVTIYMFLHNHQISVIIRNFRVRILNSSQAHIKKITVNHNNLYFGWQFMHYVEYLYSFPSQIEHIVRVRILNSTLVYIIIRMTAHNNILYLLFCVPVYAVYVCSPSFLN